MPPKQRAPTKSFMDYINEKSIGCDRPFVMNHVYEKYRKECGYQYSSSQLLRSFKKTWGPRMHRLRLRATIELDEQGRITKYESPTMSLHGQHARTSSRRRRQPVNYSDDVEEEEENEQEEEDVPPTPPPPRDDVQLIDGMCAPVPLKHEVTAEYAGTELVPYTSYSNQTVVPYAPPPATSFPAGGLIGGMSNFMNALSGMMQSQTEMIKAIRQSSSTSTTGPAQVPQETQATISVSEFLKHIQQWILSSNRIQLAEFHQKVAVSLQNLTGENRKIPVSRLKLALEAAFSICSSSVGNGAQMHHVNLKEFVAMLLMYASSQQLYGFCEQIKQKFDGFRAETVISIDTARTALEAAFGIVME
ncbi:hypothetical protein CAEBREN_18318 [Caenorhabditis brenneri]|uniref:SPK domain-containing protein n=1 Tax=Caenorhabditis brenneri TaxID=135651 RepID=G0NBX9_CAEBE|nr:hypothetical protein CAEBREN_18318 [Caenorhabditis brenneri]